MIHNSPKSIALLGSPFNPPHLGHLSIARQVLDFCPVDAVWLMPTYRYDPAFGKTMVSFHHRLRMAQFMERPRISVSDFEKNVAGVSHTFDILTALKKAYPKLAFSFVIGSDWVEKFESWYRWQDLLNIAKFYVFPRKKYTAIKFKKNMEVVASPLLQTTDISSSQIRQKILLGKPIKDLVPKEVASYINLHNLYGRG